tara:strand:- start:1066 stop:1821 length:756 start_codon:yes stop_codon:yes gene_type:complete
MSINLFDLTGKVALVTGAVHGLGMAMAKGLGNAGATIVVNNYSEEALDAAVAEYKACGLNAFGYVFDVTDEKEVVEAIEKIEKEVGAIDILVNNAGIIKRTPIVDMEVEDFKAVIDVDLVGPFIVSKNVAKGMIKRGGGKIINICSMMSELGRDTVSALTVSLPNSLIIEQMLMIFPPPLLIIPFATFLETIKGPTKSTSITALKSSTSMSTIGVLLMIPALFTKISIAPTSFSIFSIASTTSFSSVTSNT